jgi:aminoglycoside 6'-N-acetyltransferase I
MTGSSGVAVRLLGSDEAAVLERVAPDVFDRAIDPRRSAEFLADPRHHLAVAFDGDRVIGMASALHYVHPDKEPELFVNEVGVAEAYRRQGLDRRLLDALLARGRALGCTEAWVLTDEGICAARSLYRGVGGREEERPVYVTFALRDG